MTRGEVVDARPRRRKTQRFAAHGPEESRRGKPLVVLINGGSASASEIVAGALHDHKRATLIRTRSFGKGSVQTIIPLGTGNAWRSLRRGISRRPGHSIRPKGVTPDIEVLQDVLGRTEDPCGYQGRGVHARSSVGRRRGQTGSQAYAAGGEEDDKALAAAFNLLRGVTVNAGVP